MAMKKEIFYNIQLKKTNFIAEWSFFHNIAGSELPQVSMEHMTQKIWQNNDNIAESFVIPNKDRITNSAYLFRYFSSIPIK